MSSFIRTLFLGDPHVQASNIEESERLLQFTLDNAIKHDVNQIVILGDLLHTHAIIRMEVQHFWDKWLEKLSQHKKTVVIVGNHDKSSNQDGSLHAINVFKRINNDNLKIIDTPAKDGLFVYIPYIHDKETFIKTENSLSNSSSILVCHQTFNGSTYENGMYAPDGIEPSLLVSKSAIVGHVHLRQRFGKIIYPGTARWLTTSDANHEKGIWLTEHDSNANLIKEEYIDTSLVCTPIIQVTWKEGQEQPEIPKNARVSLELIGSSDWITKNRVLFKNRVSIKTKITDRARKEARRSTGLSFSHFLENIYSSKNSKEMLKYAQEVGIV